MFCPGFLTLWDKLQTISGHGQIQFKSPGFTVFPGYPVYRSLKDVIHILLMFLQPGRENLLVSPIYILSVGMLNRDEELLHIYEHIIQSGCQ